MSDNIDYTQTHKVNPRWIGYFAALWILLLALAQIKTIRALVIAFTWLMVLSALMLILGDESFFKKLGL